LTTLSRPKNIRVSDWVTLFNLLIGLDGYTISTGVISHELHSNDIIAVPLKVDEWITVEYITHTCNKLCVGQYLYSIFKRNDRRRTITDIV
jgi:hypothetical protein